MLPSISPSFLRANSACRANARTVTSPASVSAKLLKIGDNAIESSRFSSRLVAR